jgi:hypothetical protein
VSKRNRNRRPARGQPRIDPKCTILVVSEGKVTEPEYLNGFVDYAKNQRVKLEIVPGAGAPRTIVEIAKEKKRENEERANCERDENIRYDHVWCVFDIDNHPNVPDAKQMARDNGIELAISNPCVEIWLWLHFADQPGLKDRHTLQTMMGRHISGYCKDNKHVNFQGLQNGYSDAVRRAKRLDDDAKQANEEGRNPSTGFWKLTEQIQKNA